MNEDNYRGDDLISRPPAGAVLVRKIGSWDILFSEAEQILYIVPIDYHPEPFRISLSDLNELQASLAPKPSPQPAPQPQPQPQPQPIPQTGSAPKQKPAKKKKRRHSKRKKKRG
jgi:hypothetical protein